MLNDDFDFVGYDPDDLLVSWFEEDDEFDDLSQEQLNGMRLDAISEYARKHGLIGLRNRVFRAMKTNESAYNFLEEIGFKYDGTTLRKIHVEDKINSVPTTSSRNVDRQRTHVYESDAKK